MLRRGLADAGAVIVAVSTTASAVAGFLHALGAADAAHGHRQRLAIRRVLQRFLRRDELLAIQREQVLVEALLPVAGGADVVVQLERAALEDVLRRHRPAAEDFRRRAAGAVPTDDEPLAD